MQMVLPKAQVEDSASATIVKAQMHLQELQVVDVDRICKQVGFQLLVELVTLGNRPVESVEPAVLVSYWCRQWGRWQARCPSSWNRSCSFPWPVVNVSFRAFVGHQTTQSDPMTNAGHAPICAALVEHARGQPLVLRSCASHIPGAYFQRACSTEFAVLWTA